MRAAHGETTLLAAIAEYENAMRRYGFAAVRGSLEAMKAQLEAGALARAASRAALRLMNRIPPLKRRFFLALAAERPRQRQADHARFSAASHVAGVRP